MTTPVVSKKVESITVGCDLEFDCGLTYERTMVNGKVYWRVKAVGGLPYLNSDSMQKLAEALKEAGSCG